jgi:hypothetical protein
MGPQATRNCVIINSNRAIPIVLGLINEIYDVNEMRLSQSLSSLQAEGGKHLELKHPWRFTFLDVIVNLPTHWTVKMHM